MVSIIFSFFIVFLIILFWHTLWQEYAVDKIRDDLFSIRADMFDYTYESKKIKFDHPAYRSLEKKINNMIYFADKMGVIRILFFHFFVKIDKEKLLKEKNNILKNIQDKEVCVTFSKFEERFMNSLLKHLLRRSFLFLIFFIISFILAFILYPIVKFIRILLNKTKDINLNIFKSKKIKDTLLTEIELQTKYLIVQEQQL